MTSQIESRRWTQYTSLYENNKFERETSQWRLLYVVYSNPQCTTARYEVQISNESASSNNLSYHLLLLFSQVNFETPDDLFLDPKARSTKFVTGEGSSLGRILGSWE